MCCEKARDHTDFHRTDEQTNDVCSVATRHSSVEPPLPASICLRLASADLITVTEGFLIREESGEKTPVTTTVRRLTRSGKIFNLTEKLQARPRQQQHGGLMIPY